MPKRQVTIINELGLHARTAAQIASLAQQARTGIWIEKDGRRVDAASTLDILTLQCAQGVGIRIGTDDTSDLTILNRIEKLIKNGFGE